MNYVMIAQFAAAAVFVTIAVIHFLVWLRAHRELSHLLFAATASAAGANAIAEAYMYQADSVDVMSNALKWYVTTSGLWAIASICFIVSYAPVGRVGRIVAKLIVGVFLVALLINLVSTSSFLYVELTGLREIIVPWGESVWLAVGTDNPWRLAVDLTLPAVFVLVALGCYGLWRDGQHHRAVVFGATIFLFMSCFTAHAFLIDTGRLDSPYLSTYGFLALVALTSYDLAGEVVRTSELSSELRQMESELQTAVMDERNRIAGDLHDSVTQTLFSTAAIADALPDVWQRSPEAAMSGLEDLKCLTRGALAEMRTLLLELHPASLVDKELGVLLRQLADAAAGRTQLPVESKIDGKMRFPAEVQVALYRAAQESINNVIRHAEATKVTLRLVCSEGKATLTVRDDGCGFNASQATSGMGLRVMQERISAIGGECAIESQPHGGTTITVKWQPEQSRQNHDDR